MLIWYVSYFSASSIIDFEVACSLSSSIVQCFWIFYETIIYSFHSFKIDLIYYFFVKLNDIFKIAPNLLITGLDFHRLDWINFSGYDIQYLLSYFYYWARRCAVGVWSLKLYDRSNIHWLYHRDQNIVLCRVVWSSAHCFDDSTQQSDILIHGTTDCSTKSKWFFDVA